jgi:hypothetical protein
VYTFAYIALLAFIVIAFAVVRSSRGDDLAQRACVVFLVGLLFLPNRVAFNLPGVPDIGKQTLAGLVPLLALASMPEARAGIGKIFGGVPGTLLWLSAFGYLGTWLGNTERLRFGSVVMPGLTIIDGISGVLAWLLRCGSAFFLARAVIRTPRDVEALLKAFVVIALCNLPICLIELRLSPQFHKWVYGFQVIGFGTVTRGDGYKPVGFLGGGLGMAIFLFSGVTAATGLSLIREKVFGVSAKWWLVAIWAVLAVSKNLGANIFGLVMAVTLIFFSWKMALRLATILIVTALMYPYLRGAGIVDVYPILDWIRERAPDRAASLGVRLINEDQLLQRAMLKPIFGWGGYGRNQVYDENGTSLTIQDGAWIITLGYRGLVGLVGLFGVVGWPSLGWTKHLEGATDRQRTVVSCLVLLTGFRLVDLLPNGLFTPEPYFLAGALSGLFDHRRLWLRQR